MFTREQMQTLLNNRPFVPFRMWLSDGGHVDVISRELVLPGRYSAVIALLDPSNLDIAPDRYATIVYMHVTRHEMLVAGPPPFTSPPNPSGSPTPTPA